VTEAEALAAMTVAKTGDPPQAWQQHRTHRGLATLEFGLLDPHGAAIPGLHVECVMVRGTRVAFTGWKITLFRSDGFNTQRAYQIDNPGRAGTRLGDHDFPHEHVADARQPDNPAWAGIGFAAMLDIFCQRCNLLLGGPVPDPEAFTLR